MTKQKDTTANPAMMMGEPMMEWWQKQMTQGFKPVTRMQLAWMHSMVETMQLEAEYLQAIAQSGQKIAESLEGEAPQSAAEWQERYQQLISDVTEAQMERMKKAAEISTDFKRCVWEEI